MYCPSPLYSSIIIDIRLIHFWINEQFSCRIPKSPLLFPQNIRTWSLYPARILSETAREWRVAPVQIGFGSGLIIIENLYQPVMRLLSCVKAIPAVTHSFHCRLIASSTSPNFQWCPAISGNTCFLSKKICSTPYPNQSHPQNADTDTYWRMQCAACSPSMAQWNRLGIGSTN